MSAPRSLANKKRSRRVLHRRLVVFVLILAVALLTIIWSWLLYSTLETQTSESSLPRQTPLEETPILDYYGEAIYPREIDDPVVEKAIVALKDEPQSTSSRNQDFAIVTRQSNQHAQNQDRSVIFYPYPTRQTPGTQPSFLACVFDGHGVEGHIVAEYVVQEFPRRLAEKLNQRPCCASDEWIIQQLKDTFVEVDKTAPQNAWRGGCTGTVTLRMGHKLFVANAGDSRTILGDYKGSGKEVNISYTSRSDKPNLPDERARIEGLGGKIHIPAKNPFLSRVVVFSKAATPPEPIGLAMSRSIGDWEWKLVGVTAEPLVDIFDLSNQTHSFLVAASDGLWDLRRPQFFAKQFGESFYGGGRNPMVACVETILQVSPQKKEWYRDDITVIVIRTSESVE
jgi:serine/threonine protein phosphatase PrpC